MINKLRFNDISQLYFMGDIHGEFDTCVFKINSNLKNSLTIVCGDISLGFNKDEYYYLTFKKLNLKLKKENNHLCFVRGNHDCPEEFNDPIVSKKWNKYSNIHVIPDYTIIEVYETDFLHTANILCVGGATSIDRLYRLAQEKQRFGKKTYWSNELPFIDEEKLKEINQEYNNNIQIICTHTCPSFSYPQTKDGILSWMIQDSTLESTLDKERGIMDILFWTLKDGGQNSIEKWVYGHYHNHHKEIHHNIEFLLCDCLELNPYKYKPILFE